ncbi:MAG TPA: hypothetical protein VFX15_07175 [Actinomycetes bacterium]|nr:hypothetical protein [Actinomycetes bacterium]
MIKGPVPGRRTALTVAIVLGVVLVAASVVGIVRRDSGPPLPAIAYSVPTDLRQYDVFVADDGKRTQLTDDKLSYAPSWSPDGTQLAYVRGEPDTWEECCGYGAERIWLMDADGSDPRPISPPQWSPASTPQWMPDGESLLFTVVREFKGNADAADLVKLDLESGEVNAVRPFLPTYEFALAPDGARIAQPRRGGIAIIDIATGRERLIAQGLVRQASEIAWSADGTWLAFNAHAMGTAAPRLWAWNLVSDELVPIDISRGEINGHVWVGRQRLLYCSDEWTALTLATVTTGYVLKQEVTEFEAQFGDDETESCLGYEMSARPD